MRSAGSTAVRRLFGIAVGTTLLVGSMVGLGATPATAGPSEGSFVSMVNNSRADRGRAALKVRSDLIEVARAQAKRMAKRNDLYHNPNLASDVDNWQAVGENVGYGPDAATIEQAFMNSPAHKANILDRDFREIGVGTAVDSKGTLWVAQVFRKPTGSNASTGSGNASAGAKKASKKKATSAKKAAPSTRKATAKKPAAKPVVKSTPQPVVARPTPAPVATPAQLWQKKVATVAAWTAPTSNDPVSDSLAFAAAMNALAP